MNWSDFKSDPAGEATADEQLCPEGTHVAKIGWVKIQAKDWAKNPANKQGLCLTVRLDVKPGIKAVFKSIPCHRRGAVEALCRAARVDPPAGEWDESCLVGQMVAFESVLAVSNAGHDYVKIAKWKPGQDQLPAELRDRPAKRTPLQKADAAASAGTNDDIPF